MRAATLERVLETLAEAVRECGKVIDRAKLSEDEDYIDAVVDDECEVLESIVGTAFVAAQTEITRVKTHIQRIHSCAKRDGHILKSSNGTKSGILKLGSPPGVEYSKVQLIDAFANYFKHRDDNQWRLPWTEIDPKAQAKQTAVLITAAGAQEGSSGNLRSGLESLGIDYEDLIGLHKEVTAWAKAVAETYEGELKALKLL